MKEHSLPYLLVTVVLEDVFSAFSARKKELGYPWNNMVKSGATFADFTQNSLVFFVKFLDKNLFMLLCHHRKDQQITNTLKTIWNTRSKNWLPHLFPLGICRFFFKFFTKILHVFFVTKKKIKRTPNRMSSLSTENYSKKKKG